MSQNRALDGNVICVFCGSGEATESLREETSSIAAALVGAGHPIVYGGGNIGLMGVLANSALARGGRVTGVIPQFLVDMELGHRGLTSLEIVSSMHERKARMTELSDAFIALPGGLGTLEEFFEVLTWLQLGLHPKPCILYNASGYYTTLIEFLDGCVDSGLLSKESRKLIIICTSADQLLVLLSGIMQTDRFDEQHS